MADGVYSMFADFAPFDELRALLDRHEQLHLYIDDSHGVGWAGKHGRGPALEALGVHPRVVVAVLAEQVVRRRRRRDGLPGRRDAPPGAHRPAAR